VLYSITIYGMSNCDITVSKFETKTFLYKAIIYILKNADELKQNEILLNETYYSLYFVEF